MTAAEVAQDEASPTCWCCGQTFPEEELLRLGDRPEAAVCVRCARSLERRAQELRDRQRPSAAARGRAVVNRGRAVVVEHGWHRAPVIGPALRWLGDRLP